VLRPSAEDPFAQFRRHLRHPVHIVVSAEMGADVATLPFKTLSQLYRHPLTDIGLENFLSDWRATGKSFDD